MNTDLEKIKGEWEGGTLKKKEIHEDGMSLKSFFNLAGVFIFTGILISIYTQTYHLDHNLNIVQKVEMSTKKMIELGLFFFITSGLYYLLMNLYFARKKKAFFIILTFFSIGCMIMAIDEIYTKIY